MANNIERRKDTKIKVRWPTTVLTDAGTIEGKTRYITVEGVFMRCKEPLRPSALNAFS